MHSGLPFSPSLGHYASFFSNSIIHNRISQQITWSTAAQATCAQVSGADFFAPTRRWEEESRWCIIENWERACGATKSSLRSYVAPSPDWSGRSHLCRGVTTKEYSKNYKQIVTTKIIRTIKKTPQKPLPLVPSNWQKGDSNWHGFEVTTFSTERRDGPSSPLYNHTANRRIACCNYERDDSARF